MNDRKNGYRLLTAVCVLLLSSLLAGCGERPQLSAQPGLYRGKPDTHPWDNPRFQGDRTAWEMAVKDRARNQNEYNRIR